MQIKQTCPLGSECEKALDGVVERCAWFVEIAGTHPQTGDSINESKCAMAWMPILLCENARTNRGQTAAIESLRNEQVSGQQAFNQLIQRVAATRKQIDGRS